VPRTGRDRLFDGIAAGLHGRRPTVSDLFRLVADSREQGVTPLEVGYDAQLGYPVRIEAGSLAADAGTIYTAAALEPLAP
jgi:hypothetical protein